MRSASSRSYASEDSSSISVFMICSSRLAGSSSADSSASSSATRARNSAHSSASPSEAPPPPPPPPRPPLRVPPLRLRAAWPWRSPAGLAAPPPGEPRPQGEDRPPGDALPDSALPPSLAAAAALGLNRSTNSLKSSVPSASVSVLLSTRSASPMGRFHFLHRLRSSSRDTRPSRFLSIFRKASCMDEKRSWTSMPISVMPIESSLSADAAPIARPVMMS
mmetsp:Transcript_62108/g.139934  ORF Transcript_62108/g.139934 Transcript_62108/m.139934 type:complete len:220 (-) Transcript_62108:553-1212(-)